MSLTPTLNVRSSKTPSCPRESTKLSASILIYRVQFRTVSNRESNRLHTNERPASLFVGTFSAVQQFVMWYLHTLHVANGGSRLLAHDGTFVPDYVSSYHQSPLFVVSVLFGHLFKTITSFLLVLSKRIAEVCLLALPHVCLVCPELGNSTGNVMAF